MWAPITLDVALELLDYHFADERVRALAVHQLEKLTNEELRLYLLQLTQVRCSRCQARIGSVKSALMVSDLC